MATRFFITGLPRSRTAWLAAFLSTGKTMCYHEPSARMARIEEIGELYEHPAREYTHVGISDAGLGFWARHMLDTHAPRTLVVVRSKEAVRSSLADIGVPAEPSLCDVAMSRLMEIRHHPLALWVPFDSLNDERVIQNVWFHLLPGVPFDVTRYREFAKFNIQVSARCNGGIMKENHGLYEALESCTRP